MKRQLIPCILLLAMAGCTNESELAGGSDYISRVTITAKDFEAGDAATRTAFEVSSSGLTFKWATTDVVGIYPNEGDQVSFPMTAGAGTNSASFDGGGWALKGNYTYAAYFPYNVDNTTKGRSYTSLPICFTGQKQTVNNSTADMGDYDYMVATASTPASGNVNFNFEHVGSVLYVQLVSPVAETFTRLTLSTEDALWTTDATVNIATGELTPTNIAKEISVDLSNISVAANGTLYVWLMVVPANMMGKTITASAEGSTGTYTAEIAGKTLMAGKAYQLKGTLQKPGTGGTGSDIGWGDEDDVDASQLVGTWRRDWNGGGGYTTMVINEDGTARQKESDGDGDTFTWDFNEELHQYILMDDGGEYYYVVLSCTETTLVLRDSEHYEEVGDEVYTRVTTGEASVGMIDGHEYVDLALPSGTMWATMNVGATSETDYGDYFAWGETTGYKSGKTNFSCSTYKWCKGSSSTMTKYCTDSSYGTVDGISELQPSDDAATANWGSGWQMPSVDQYAELINSSYTTTEWTTVNGVNGRKITSKKNGNSIFLPAAGFRTAASLGSAGSSGYYWSRSLDTSYSSYGRYLYFYSSGIRTGDNSRYCGRGVRPVVKK